MKEYLSSCVFTAVWRWVKKLKLSGVICDEMKVEDGSSANLIRQMERFPYPPGKNPIKKQKGKLIPKKKKKTWREIGQTFLFYSKWASQIYYCRLATTRGFPLVREETLAHHQPTDSCRALRSITKLPPKPVRNKEKTFSAVFFLFSFYCENTVRFK